MTNLSRRTLIKRVVSGGGLAFGLSWHVTQAEEVEPLDEWHPNLWLTIYPDNQVEIVVERTEMGQGILHGMATILIDECDLNPELVTFKQAGFNREFNNREYNIQITGGSTSMSQGYEAWRTMAASIRGLMMRSAAEELQKKSGKFKTMNGQVIFTPTGESMTYGELINQASTMDLEDFPLKKDEDLNYIGKDRPRFDALPKSTGKAIFGIDATVENLKIATIIHCPYFKGKLKHIRNEEKVLTDGVRGIFEISNGVAVVADNYWLASKVASELDIEWISEVDSSLSNDSLLSSYRKNLDGADVTVKKEGDVEKEFATHTNIFEAEYVFPFCPHKTLEPMNTTCSIQNNKCHIKTPTQAPALAMEVAKEVTGFPEHDIEIEVTYLGGGFGRRLNADYIREAVEIAYVSKTPIKLIWSREEDMQNDFYRPMAIHRFRATLGDKNEPTAWHHKYATQPILPSVVSEWAPAMLPSWTPGFIKNMVGSIGSTVTGAFPANDVSSEGAKEIPYDIKNLKIEMSPQEAPIPIGFWRSVGHSLNGPAIECFLDELIEHANMDPFDYRMDLLKDKPRYQQVLKTLREFSKWDSRDKNKFYGVAQHFSFRSYTAQLVQLRKLNDNKFKIEKVFCVADCGLIVNPDVVKMQLESGIIFGISSALYDQLPIEGGIPRINNFHDSQVLRMNQAPEILVQTIASDQKPTGVGEISVPSSIPALMNAVSRGLGQRVRSLPMGEYFG